MGEQEQNPHPSCQQWESTEPSLLLSVHSSGSKCCKKYYPRKILESKIQDYNYTPSNCKLKAVR